MPFLKTLRVKTADNVHFLGKDIYGKLMLSSSAIDKELPLEKAPAYSNSTNRVGEKCYPFEKSATLF